MLRLVLFRVWLSTIVKQFSVYDRVYNTPVIIVWVLEFITWVVYLGGVVYTVPPVIKWVIDCLGF